MPDYQVTLPDGRRLAVSGPPDPHAAQRTLDQFIQTNPPKGVGDVDAYLQGQRDERGRSLASSWAGWGQQVENGVPFLREGYAALAAGLNAPIRLFTGQPQNLKSDFDYVYSRSRGQQDETAAEHPAATALSRIAGATGAGLALGPGLSGARTAAVTAIRVPATLAAGSAQLVRNALMGGLTAGVYQASQPGTLDERLSAAGRAAPGGAVAGAALPLVASAGAAGVRASRNAFATVAPFVRRFTATTRRAADSARPPWPRSSPADQTPAAQPIVRAAVAPAPSPLNRNAPPQKGPATFERGPPPQLSSPVAKAEAPEIGPVKLQEYRVGGGHHIPAKKVFEGADGYDVR